MTQSLDEEILELENEAQQQTDEFYSQEQIIETLTSVLDRQRKGAVFVAPQPVKKAPNYLLYIAIAAAAFLFLKK